MKTLFSRFDQRVRQAPQQIAIGSPEASVTYQQLADQAAVVGRAIRSTQVSRGRCVVAVYCRQQANGIVSLLGILWADMIACCLPVDVDLDEARRIARHSQATLILTDQAFEQRVMETVSRNQNVLNVEQILRDDAGESRSGGPSQSDRNQVPWRKAGPDDPAVIIYTSGSSGVPKGVLHHHRSLVSNSEYHAEALSLRPLDCELLVAHLSTISGLTDLFRNLFSGGKLVTLNLLSSSLEETAEQIRQSRPDRLHLVPTVFRRLAQQPNAEQTFATLRLLHLGGEPVTRYDFELFKRVTNPDCRLLNNYGASEVPTIRQGLFYHESIVNTERLPFTHAVPVKELRLEPITGRDETPVEDVSDIESTGSSILGEIVVRTAFAAAGYWRDSKRTGETFAPADDDSRRIEYRTGDLGQQLPDGTLLHLGRIDRQTKVAGQKVDLTAVESLIRTHPDVAEASVEARTDQDATQLVAHVVLHEELGELKQETLVQWLMERADKRMVPHRWIQHRQLPTLRNGKVDRHALRQSFGRTCDTFRNEIAVARVTQSNTMSRLASIWQQVLQTAVSSGSAHDPEIAMAVGPDTSFFEIGGDSLSASELARRLTQEFGQQLDVAGVFCHPTLRDLADFLEHGAPGEARREYVDAFVVGNNSPTLYCVGDHRPLGLVRSRFAGQINAVSLLIDGVQTARFRGLRIEEMVDCFRTELSALSIDPPDIVMGFSYGGLIAAALTAAFCTADVRPKLLLLEPSIPGKPFRASRRERWSRRIRSRWISSRWILRRTEQLNSDPNEPFEECRSVIEDNIKQFRPSVLETNVAIYGGADYFRRAQPCWRPYLPRAEWSELQTNGNHMQTIQPELARHWLDRLNSWIHNTGCKDEGG